MSGMMIKLKETKQRILERDYEVFFVFLIIFYVSYFIRSECEIDGNAYDESYIGEGLDPKSKR